MKLIENEKVLMKNSSGELVLTNFRVVKSQTIGGLVNYSSIQLNQISSVQFSSLDSKWLLYGGLFICAVSILACLEGAEINWGGMIAGTLFGGIFILAYFFNRKQTVRICGTGGESIYAITSEKFETAFKFIFAVEHVMKTGSLPPEEQKTNMVQSA